MSVREGHICGVPARLFRVSFTGELGYEINVPADYGPMVWEAIFAAANCGITPYGTETMHVLRAEKGYIVIGQETDGTVIPIGSWPWLDDRLEKPDFVGKRSLTRPDMLRHDRKQLVGLLSADLLEEGAQLVCDSASVGHVTSAYWSETLQHRLRWRWLRRAGRVSANSSMCRCRIARSRCGSPTRCSTTGRCSAACLSARTLSPRWPSRHRSAVRRD